MRACLCPAETLLHRAEQVDLGIAAGKTLMFDKSRMLEVQSRVF
jgi:hypothetical protein